MINDNSHGNITKHLGCNVLLYYKFIIQLVGEIFFLKFANIRQSYGQNGWLLHAPYSPRAFLRKEAELAS